MGMTIGAERSSPLSLRDRARVRALKNGTSFMSS